MKRTKLRNIILLMSVLLIYILIFTSCGKKDNNVEPEIPDNSDTPTTTLVELSAPQVVLDGDTATWSSNEQADKFEISIDGTLSFVENTVTSKKLENGQTFKIRAIGDRIKYSNSGWSNSVTYTAKTDTPENKYTVIWKNGDTVLEVDENIVEGTVPAYNGTVPTKESDAQYTYIFEGWSPEITEVTGDITYNAVFASALREYTVTWKNGDTVLETDTNVEYGTTPVYNGAVPQKESDAENNYTFTGWSPEVVSVSSDIVYSAVFSSSVNTYTVTWKNGDTVLETDENVAYGATPVYGGPTPTKTSNDQYTYKFIGWTPQISSVTNSVTYTAQFEEIVNTYTVSFYSEDGLTLLDAVSVEYGATAVYSNATPSKNATDGYTYSFDKWVTAQGGTTEDDLKNVVSNRNVYASFKENVRNVSVNVISNQSDYGTVSIDVLNNIPYGSKIVVDSNEIRIDGQTVTAQVKDATAQYTYIFTGWITEETVGNNTVIKANFERVINKYTITWKNGDTVLETDENVEYGTTPIYNGNMPTKDADADYTYTFCGWSPAISTVTENAVYQVQFTNAKNKYTVTFYDDDGTTILGVSVVEKGQTAVYPNVLPTKASTAQYTYVFDKWLTALNSSTEAILTNITTNLSVYAGYTSSVRTYTVTFNDWDGTELYKQTVAYGNDATPPEEPERDGYRFDGWNGSYASIDGDITITAKYQATVLVQFIDYNGTIIYSEYIDRGDSFTNTPQDPSRSNYAFNGWSTTDFTNIVEDLIVYAQYIRTYRVTFTDFDGTVIKSENVKTGEAAIAPNSPTREGYSFTGWNSTFNSITSNTTITALYQINKYTVTFVGADGKVLSTIENVKHGFPVAAPEVQKAYFDWTTRKGYTFTGWDKSYSVITGNTTITAIYDKEITEPIIVVRNEAIASGETEAAVRVYICSSQTIYGLSLDMTFDKALQQGGKDITIDVRNTFGNMNADYTSKITDECTYELRWTDGDGIDPADFSGPIALLTLNFSLDEFQTNGDYLVNILESTYLIDENLTKVTPVVISGMVTIGE